MNLVKKMLGRNDVLDMTQGDIKKQMLRFALPVFISQLFSLLYSTVDAFIVGRFMDPNALAAVTSSGTLIYLLVSFFNGTSMGAGVVISKYFGAGDNESVSRAIHTNIALGLVNGTVLTIVGVLFTPTFLVWMRTPEAVMPKAVEYFRYYFLGVYALTMYGIFNGIMNAVGNSKRPLFYLIISSMLNVVLDVLFIGVFGWGVWSAAVATVIAQGTSCLLCLSHLMRKGRVYTVSLRKIRFHKDMLAEIIRYGLPSGIQNSVIGIANVLVQSNINLFGADAVAAYGTHAKIEGFGFLPITSFTMAISTFISQNLGAHEYDRAKKGARFGILSGVLLAEAIGVVSFIFVPYFMRFFGNNEAAVAFGTQQARTVALFYCLLSFSHCIAAVCRGSGKAFVPMFVMLSVWCVFRIIYITTIMHFFPDKIGFIYWAYPITWSISSIIYFIYYKKSDWIHGFDRTLKL